ncbi:MAG: UDP-glucose/GDP-mannose dehydrogenase family protein [Syntrophobacterales bacterium]|jgi:UDPglucose 6-dehydrogenase|nr:UDP-glucose/GDP-mannose dehydrogenase family protein [Syntrophobacterales bacterium]
MKLAIIGAGYVGLVTAACFAEMGNEVICVDADAAKVAALEQGRIPIYEPGLEDYVKRNFQEHRLGFTTDLGPAIQKSLVCFIAVGTPQDRDGSADLSMVLQVAKDIGRHMNGYKVIVEKSTVPVGTAKQVRQVILEELQARGESFEFDVVSNPEFLKEGTAIDDFMKPDRIVAGCDEVRVAELMKELYAPFVRTNHPIIIMDVVSSELTKYAANAFLATKISFINEMANICSKTGANIAMVRQGIGSDRRIGPLFLFPGLGYGGSCFPKDMQALIHTARAHRYTPRLLEAAEAVNQDQRRIFSDLIATYFGNDLKGKVFAVWGLSFKPQTDDIRDAPALTIISRLVEAGARVQAYDPEAMNASRQHFGDQPGVSFAASGYAALEGADALIICTEWTKFREPDFDRMRSLLKAPVIFDGRNLYNPVKLANLGFTYFHIGQKVD